MAIRLKTLEYSPGSFSSGSQNNAQQVFLLKALEVTQDPKKFREMLGVKTVADVYRTLDKMGIRKEYHESLHRNGISMDYLVRGLKGIAETGFKDADRLKAYQTLLKSVGLEKYENSTGASEGSWEDVLMKKIEQEKKLPVRTALLAAPVQYEVKQPVIPESVKLAQKEEAEMTSTLYEDSSKPNN